MSKTKTSKRAGYSTDVVAFNLYSNLLRDFRASEGSAFLKGAEFDLLTDRKLFRSRVDYPRLENGFASVGLFKRARQMESLFKKYRFNDDAFDDEELSQRTKQKFIDDQVRLHNPLNLKTTGYRVLQRARVIAQRILGECPPDEVIENVRFGKKSSIGCPFSLAYLDFKLSNTRAFTGTQSTSKFFFDQVLPGDHILKEILKNHNPVKLKENLNVPHLNLVEVPKTWKSYRLITPLTLLGLFYSYGVGRIVTKRLKDAGLNISKLQDVHRNLVKGYSATCSHATADLSAASDSLTSELLNRVLPRRWYNAVKKTFVRVLNIDGTSYSTASVLPMGNGATFPIETLVFYSIIKAIGELTGTKGTYSVYGDDLIYPSALHRYVVAIFPQLHLKLNADKTFVGFPFRESCGSDFYRGQDVRPFFLRGEACTLSKVRYEAFLYKVYNGLVARWDPYEIRATLTWLLSELAMVSDAILRVPPSYPDYSGLKVSHASEIPLSYTLLPFSPITMIQNTLEKGKLAQFKGISHGSRWYQFDFLTETAKKRVVISTLPYYWLSLQGLTDDVECEDFSQSMMLSLAGRRERAVRWLKNTGEAVRSSLAWKLQTKLGKIFYVKGRKVQKKKDTIIALVDSKQGSTVSKATTKTDSISDWI